MAHIKVVAGEAVNPGYVLKAEPIAYPERMDVMCERKKEIKMVQVFFP